MNPLGLADGGCGVKFPNNSGSLPRSSIDFGKEINRILNGPVIGELEPRYSVHSGNRSCRHFVDAE